MSADAPMTVIECNELYELETVISKGKQAFFEVSDALRVIRDRRLYRRDHRTFEAYCQDKWGWSRQYASLLIGSAQVVKSLPAPLSTMVDNPRQARAVADIPQEHRAEVLKAVKDSGEPVTAKAIKQKAAEIIEADEPSPALTPEEELERVHPKKRAPRAVGMEVARQVMSDLETIPADDAEREAALDEVQAWLVKHR